MFRCYFLDENRLNSVPWIFLWMSTAIIIRLLTDSKVKLEIWKKKWKVISVLPGEYRRIGGSRGKRRWHLRIFLSVKKFVGGLMTNLCQVFKISPDPYVSTCSLRQKTVARIERGRERESRFRNTWDSELHLWNTLRKILK